MKVKKLLVSVLTLITIVLCCFMMTGCGKVGAVDESSMRYDGKKFTWGEVKNAETYVVEYDGKPHTTKTASYSYTAKSNMDEVTLTVYAVGKNDKEGKAVSRTFTRLEKIAKSDITFSYDGIMSWNSVDGADEYIVQINGKEHVVNETEYADFEYGKNNQIKVKPNASDGSTFAEFSDTITKNYLGSPTGIKYDGEIISWKGANVVSAGASGVKGYRIFVDGGELETITDKEFVYDANMQDFTVSIQAVGDEVENGNTFSSPMSEEKTFIYLPQITLDQINIKDGVMSWDEIEKADGYTLKINGAKENITATSKELVSGTELDIEIKPYVEEGDVYYSVFSETMSVYILTTPVVEWNNFELSDGKEKNVIRWNQVQGATGYNVRVYSPDATEPTDYDDLGEAVRDFSYAFVTPGEYRISVQGLTNVENNYPSKMSEEYIITRLESPTLAKTNAVVSTPDEITNGFTLTWDPVTGASDYQIYKDGAKVNSLTVGNKKNSKTIVDVIDQAVTEQKEFVYVVQSLGKIEGRRINLPSIYDPEDTTKGEICSVDITVLAQPSNLYMDGFDAKWTGNGDYSLFSVKVNGTNNQATATSLNLSKIEAGRNLVSVCSKGNGANVLPSNYTPTEEVYKLHKPYDLKIGTTVNEGQLSWKMTTGDESYATSYRVNTHGKYDPFECNGAVSITDYIEERGVTVGVTAIANKYLNSTYYMTSDESEVREFVKLGLPTFSEVKVQNGKLKWNAPLNAGNSSFDYSVYKGDNSLIQERVSANQFDISSYPAGMHSFRVKCVGDGTTYINSDLSEIVTLRILATPEITVGEYGYSWNAIDFATAYQVTVDGVVVDTVKKEDELFYKPTTFKDKKEYEVKIYAVGDGGKTLVDSKPDTIIQKTMRLYTPTITVRYDSTSGKVEQNGKVVLTVTQAIDYANGYNYTIGGASGTSNELTYSVVPSKRGEIGVSVFAIGGKFSSDGEYYYLDSHPTTQPFNIWLLDSVSSTEIKVFDTGAITWNDIERNQGYEVIIHYANGETQTIDAQINEVSSSELKYSPTESKIMKVEISTKGNGTTIISSNYSVWER